MAKTVGGIGVVNVRELGRETSRILGQIEQGKHFLVTQNGRPVATVSPISEAALEDFVLANHRDFIDSRKGADEDLAAGGGAPLHELLDRPAIAVARLEDAGLVDENTTVYTAEDLLEGDADEDAPDEADEDIRVPAE